MTDINSTQSNANLTNNEPMTDDMLVAEVEEGVIADSSETTRPTILQMRDSPQDIESATSTETGC